MFRTIENELLSWRDEPLRKPLLMRGARQVGKSYVIEHFGQQHFNNMLTVNFELEPKYIECFTSLEPSKIIQALELLSQQRIVPQTTLLFLDEIQLCPEAIKALRYFKEKMPELHVIGAGPFLEFVMNDEAFQQPVGRVQSLYLQPCSFTEYLLASNDHMLVEHLQQATIASGIEEVIHQRLLEKCREYFILGGMPEAIETYLNNNSYNHVEKIHAAILEYYQRDLAKYQEKINKQALQKLFVKAPGLIAKHFKYVDVDPDLPARTIKPAVSALVRAGILYQVFQSKANGLPLIAGVNEKKFKTLFLDLGLAKHALGLDPLSLLRDELVLINQGDLAEQFVGQELLAYSKAYEPRQLFYWERDKPSAQAEVDYVLNIAGKIVPIEVKAGKTGRLRSLHQFLQEKDIQLGVRISEHPLSLDNNILSIPFYMISELSRLITQP